MSIKPKISVIIPTYKPSEYLENCLDSLSRQLFHEFEVIIVLNGCCEPYLSWIKETCSIHFSQLNLRIIHTDTPGVSNARNIGIDKALGEYISFMDDDDIVSESYFAEMIGNANQNGIVCSNVVSFQNNIEDANYNYMYTKAFNNILKNQSTSFFQIRKMLNGPWGKLFPRNIIGEKRFDTTLKNGEDALFNFNVSNKIKSVKFTTPNAIYFRRLRPGSATWKKHPFSYLATNAIHLNNEYLKIYFQDCKSYSLALLSSRLIATWKFVITLMIKNS